MLLKTYLQNNKITETAFAARLGVSQVTINRYVLGKRFPSPDMIRRIAVETRGKVKVADWYAWADEKAAAAVEARAQ
jgi:transcriptional regulator with XRE-family HTH domain